MQIALTGEEFQIGRRAEERIFLAPFDNLREFFVRHFPREEKFFRLGFTAFHHINFRSVIVVAGTDGDAVHTEIGDVIKHVFDFLHVGFFEHGGVGGDLITENFCHFDGGDTFFENAFALDDEVVNVFE